MAKMSLIKRKKKVGRTSRIQESIMDRKSMGAEAIEINPDSSNVHLMLAYNWYNYMVDPKTAINYLFDYLELNDKKLYKHVINIDEKHINRTLCYVANMMNKGQTMPKRIADKFENHLIELSKIVKRNVKSNKVDDTPFKENKADFVIADFEDEFDSKNFEFSAYEYMNSNTIPKAHCSTVVEHYQRLAAELEMVVKKTDKDVMEAYSIYSRKEIINMYNFVNTLIADVNRYESNKKKERKPRAKKTKAPSDLLKFIEPCKEDSNLKIVSINPENILTAKSLFAYNVKYGTLVHFVAEEDKTLSVYRTAIINFDAKLSKAKKVGRKAKEAIEIVLNGNKTQRNKVFDLVNTNEIEIPNRINGNVVLLASSNK